MSMLAKLKALSPSESALLAGAMVTLGIAALAIAIVPFRRIARFVAQRPARPAPAMAERERIIAEVRWAVRTCARRAPWRAKCFEQSLAALWLLRRRGIAANLHYGVAQRTGQGLAAHAWLRAGADDVVGCEHSNEFIELARFGQAPPV
jgi:hypothetical protein